MLSQKSSKVDLALVVDINHDFSDFLDLVGLGCFVEIVNIDNLQKVVEFPFDVDELELVLMMRNLRNVNEMCNDIVFPFHPIIVGRLGQLKAKGCNHHLEMVVEPLSNRVAITLVLFLANRLDGDNAEIRRKICSRRIGRHVIGQWDNLLFF